MLGCQFDDVFNKDVVEVLNHLSYLKAKDQHEKDLVKKWQKG